MGASADWGKQCWGRECGHRSLLVKKSGDFFSALMVRNFQKGEQQILEGGDMGRWGRIHVEKHFFCCFSQLLSLLLAMFTFSLAFFLLSFFFFFYCASMGFLFRFYWSDVWCLVAVGLNCGQVKRNPSIYSSFFFSSLAG